MMKCLFFLSFCLLPIVVFSSTFTSQNPIDLPSDKLVPLQDVTGKQVDLRLSYRIVSVFWGALGGDVYLGESPNSTAPCPDGVFRYNSDRGPNGTPVRFITPIPLGLGIYEEQAINIQFNIPTSKLCVPYTIWKVGDYDSSLGARLLETGGTIFQEDSSWFKIVKSPRLGYNLLYCPGRLSPAHQCSSVGVISQDGKRRLALVNDHPLDVYFWQIKEEVI